LDPRIEHHLSDSKALKRGMMMMPYFDLDPPVGGAAGGFEELAEFWKP